FHFFLFIGSLPSSLYPLSLHDALPISPDSFCGRRRRGCLGTVALSLLERKILLAVGNLVGRAGSTSPCAIHQPQSFCRLLGPDRDRKSTRLNSSHQIISYAVFCLKNKI